MRLHLLLFLCCRLASGCKSSPPARIAEEPSPLSSAGQALRHVVGPGEEQESRLWGLRDRARALGLEVGEEEEAMREREGRQGQDLEEEREERITACFTLIRPGWQLYDSVVREKLNRVDAGACAGECKARVYCRTFAFSESEFLGENCFLSELEEGGEGAEGLDVERDAQRDDMWGVYTVAEVCEETLRAQGKPAVPGLPGTTATSAGCECNGFIDSSGEGECRSTDTSGRYWCYANTATCPEAPTDPFLPFLARTTAACTAGPCQCNRFGFHEARSLGVCQGDVFDDSTFCYVTLESRCPDKQPSKFFPSFQWSLAACATSLPAYTTSNALPNRARVVEQHGVWNFTSTYTECRDYCGLSERCKSMHTHYDRERQVCHLSTRPFFVSSYVHSHGPSQPRHTHLLQEEDVERFTGGEWV